MKLDLAKLVRCLIWFSDQAKESSFKENNGKND